MGLLYEALTYKLRSCIFDVHSSLMSGYDEESYQIALALELRKHNIPYESKAVRYIEHRGIKVYKFVLDLIVADSVILELKYLQDDFHPANYAQILGYLKCWEKELGLLINFGQAQANIKRVIYSEKEFEISENYQVIEKFINSDNRKYLRALRTAIMTIGKMYGVGYRDTIYQSLIEVELNHQKVPFSSPNLIPVWHENTMIRKFELTLPIIANCVLCSIVAHKRNLKADLFKMKTYLRAANLQIGLLVHFGKNKLEIFGVAS